MIDFKEDEKLSVLNHSLCLRNGTQELKHLYPQAKFWAGPVIAGLILLRC